MITREEQDRLANAIRDAEALTAGEIVVVVAEQANSYRSVPILWALLAALAAPWPLMWITSLSSSRIFLIQLTIALILSVALSLPTRRYKLVPGFIKRTRAHEAAIREFVSRGLTRTRERTGVLIYVAVAERYAEIVADVGIADRVDDRVWCEAIAELIGAIKIGRAGDGLVETVRRVAAVLAEHAPPRTDNADELPNKVILI